MPRIVTMPVLAHITGTGTIYTVDNKIIVAISEILLEDLGDYARGSIIRGGITDWEAYDAKTAGFLLMGDATGTDVVSQAFDWDLLSVGAGADMIHDHTTNPEGGVLTGAAFPHTLLDAVAHTDTATQAVTQGSIIYGDATPEWNELVHPGTLYHLQTDATDVGWVQDITIADDQTLIFGTGSDGTIEYDEDGTDQVRVAGANWIFEPNLYVQDDVEIGLLAGGRFVFDSTPNPDQIKLTSGDLNLSGNDIFVPDNTASAFVLFDDGGLNYLRIISTDTQPIIRFNDGGADIDFYVESNALPDALFIRASDGQVTLGVLGAGFVQSTAGGVLSSTAIVAGDLPAHTHAGAGQGGTITHVVTTGQTTDDHHAEVHVVNSTGPHAEAALTIGHVLRVSGAAAFSFAALIAADLPAHGSTHDVGAGDPVTTTSDGAANHSRILASSAAGAITMDDYFTVNGGTFGIAGNELLTVNAAGTFAFSGISGVSVENGDWIGAGVGCAWLYDSGNGDITTTAQVGVGIVAPDGTLHVHTASAGAVAVNISADDLVVENDAAAGISILSPDANNSSVMFASPSDNQGALVGWNFDAKLFTIATSQNAGEIALQSANKVTAIYIAADQDVIFGGGTSPLGQVHIDQTSAVGAQPALFLDQGHAVHPCIRFSGDAADQDIILWDINVTGTPSLTWDEGVDSMIYSVETAATITTIDLLTLTHTTSGGAADRFGSGLLFRLESDGSAVDTMRISTVWEDATGNENAEFQLLLNYNGSLIEAGIIVGPGTVPTSAIAGLRGDGAVDFQVFRGAATHIASGNFSGLFAGRNSTASGIYSGVFAGDGNTASNTHAIVIGGFSNLSSGAYALTGGYDAHATHDNSMVFSATAAQTISWADDTFTVRCVGGSRFYSAVGTGAGVQMVATTGDWIPISAKTQDLGGASNEWDNIYYVTANTGTSRLLDSKKMCPVCDARMKRGTGTVCIMGEDADYAMAFCIECGNVAVEEWNHHQTGYKSRRNEPPEIIVENIRVKGAGRHREVAVDFRYGDVRNSTRLGDDELEIVMNGSDAEKESLLYELGMREWESREENRLMQMDCVELEAQLCVSASKIMGRNLTN